MCGRYFLEESPELRPIVEEMNRSPLLSCFPNAAAVTRSGEVKPSSVVPVIAMSRAGKRTVFPMKWGFSVPKSNGGAGLLINARTETAAMKPTFREAWTAHRCIVPASCYFEWQHDAAKKATGTKYAIQPPGQTVTWLCGLYRLEEGLPAFVILTREPGEETRFIHDRMPLILPREQIDAWISPTEKPEAAAAFAQTKMICEPAAG